MSTVFLPFQVHNFLHSRLQELQRRGPLNIIPSHYLGSEPRNHSSLKQISRHPLSALEVKVMNAHMPVSGSSCGQWPSWNHRDSLEEIIGREPCWPIFKNVPGHAPYIARTLPGVMFLPYPFSITFNHHFHPPLGSTPQPLRLHTSAYCPIIRLCPQCAFQVWKVLMGKLAIRIKCHSGFQFQANRQVEQTMFHCQTNNWPLENEKIKHAVMPAACAELKCCESGGNLGGPNRSIFDDLKHPLY